jgi:hypothetical protein
MNADDERRIIAKWNVGGRLVNADVRALYAEVVRLRAMNVYLIDRVAAASEVLGRVANKLPVCRCELLQAAADGSPAASTPSPGPPA